MPIFTGSDPAYKHKLEYFTNKVRRYFPSKTVGELIYGKPEEEYQRLVNLGTVKDPLDRIWIGSGAPALATVPNGGTVGDIYIRTDTPTNVKQRFYICTVGTGNGTLGTWVASIVSAAAIASPTAPGASYVQAEAASAKTAIDDIRNALINAGITL